MVKYNAKSDVPKHVRRTPKNRPFTIEWRWPALFDGWQTNGRYATAERRDQALAALLKKHPSPSPDYRAGGELPQTGEE